MKMNSIVKRFSFTNNFDNYPDAVIVIDYSRNITQWNKKANEIFGYSKEEMIGRNIALLFDIEAEKIYEAAESGKCYVISSKNKADENIFVDISCKAFEKNQKVLITARDVTRNQKVIEKLLFEYEKNKKINACKNNFITGLSNDFKTPIHSLIGFSQGLLDGISGELNEKQQKYVSIMNKNANLLLDLVTDFLELSRLEKEDLETNMKMFNLANAINPICDRIKQRAEAKGLHFEIDLGDITKKNAYCDETLVTKSLFIILNNAVKFTEIGSIRVKVMHPDLEFVRTHGIEITDGFDDKSYVLFSITDTGIGITEEEKASIFDEYKQTERINAKKYGGTGLKLALTKKILSRLGGSIWVESEQGQGSTFSFIIPIERPKNNIKTEDLQEIQAE